MDGYRQGTHVNVSKKREWLQKGCSQFYFRSSIDDHIDDALIRLSDTNKLFYKNSHKKLLALPLLPYHEIDFNLKKSGNKKLVSASWPKVSAKWSAGNRLFDTS